MKTRIFPAIKKQNDMLAVKRKSKEKLVEKFGGINLPICCLITVIKHTTMITQ